MSAKKLGLMISAPLSSQNFTAGLSLARTALANGISVYVYFIDRGVEGLADPAVRSLREAGGKLFACAYSLQERKLENDAELTLAGLAVLSDVIACTDRFVSFN
jgi:predicted peroxiredoxin